MAWAMGESLLEFREFNADHVAHNFSRWFDESAFRGSRGCGGPAVRISAQVAKAVMHYRRTGEPFYGRADDAEASNEALVRLAPMSMLAAGRRPETRRRHYTESCRLTHGNPSCVATVKFFGELLHTALTGKIPTDYEYAAGTPRDVRECVVHAAWLHPYAPVSSYHCVNTFEAALWSAYRAGEGPSPYELAVMFAANLGGATESITAVCGQFAGATYGYSAIPPAWLELLDRHEELLALADGLFDMVDDEAREAAEAAEADAEPLPGHAPELGVAG